MSQNVVHRIKPKPKPEIAGQPQRAPLRLQAKEPPIWRRIAAVAVVLVLLGTGYALYVYETTPVVSVITVRQQALVQTLVASGHVETPFRLNIGTQVTGTVIEVPVKEGQVVRAGELLVKLNDSEASQSVAQAQAAFDQARTRLVQMQDVAGKLANETQNQAQATLREAQIAYQRAAKLAAQGYASNASFDAARRALDVALSQVAAAALQVATNSPGGRDYQLAQTQVEQARAALKSTQARLSYTEVRSPRDGTLISRSVEVGQVVQPGAVLLVLAPAGRIQLVAQVDELNLGLLQLGQKATAVADAYSDKKFDAVLSYINPAIDPQRGTVEIKLDAANPPAFLAQDMSVSVEVIVARRGQAMALDLSAINDLNSAKPWVWVLKDRAVLRRDITRGIAGDSALEVTGGLNAGDQIVSARGLTLRQNQRIRVKAGE